MKAEREFTVTVDFPLEETDGVIEAMSQAAKAGDLAALQWCTRRLEWLWDGAEVSSGEMSEYAARLFNEAWAAGMAVDPPPDSIKDIIARIGQGGPPTEDDVAKALNIVTAFFEENMGGRSFKAACELVETLRSTVSSVEAVNE